MIKKFIKMSVILVMFVICSLFVFVFASDNPVIGYKLNQDRSISNVYYSDTLGYDINYLPGYVNESEKNILENNRIIIGNDTREGVPDSSTTLYPYRMVCQILVQYVEEPNVVYQGTGFLVGPSTIMTACHVIYHQEYGFFDTIQFGFGAYQNETLEQMIYPYGLISSWSAAMVGVYYNTYSSSDDWAIIDLSSSIGSTLGYFGLTNSIYNEDPIKLFGYSTDYEGDLAFSYGEVSSLQTYEFDHTCDSLNGASGGPLCYNEVSVCGIHHGGSSNQGYNSACRISTYIIGWINDRINS